MKSKVQELKNFLNSVRVKLFLTLTVTVAVIITLLIILNNFVLESFYTFSKENDLKAAYKEINNYYCTQTSTMNIESELERISIRNNFDILIRDNRNNNVYSSSNKDFYYTLGQMADLASFLRDDTGNVLEKNEKLVITKIKDNRTEFTYLLLSGELDNGYSLYLRIPITSIQESVKISNNFLYLIAGVTILIAAVIVTFVSRKFTDPILELNGIAKKMANLDFSHKYKDTGADDEINNLGKNINAMSETMEKTIKQLRNTNVELEKDIEEKSQIDEMRKTFISDVSHELKTPIALIQGYSEGLLENVNSDEESRKFYAEVILDETNKMDKLVKELLELMKLEYGKREFDNTKFNIIELENEIIRKSKVMLEEKNIEVRFNTNNEEPLYVYADEFYIEQVLTNYFTNAIKHCEDINGEKYIEIKNKVNHKSNKLRVLVCNTGNNIKEEEIARIWNRFYKIDESRNRDDGGTGIGLAFVKAVMNNYKNKFGVKNKSNGVEFYFELDLNKDDTNQDISKNSK